MGAMTDAQKFLFDTRGYIIIEDALSPEQVQEISDVLDTIAARERAEGVAEINPGQRGEVQEDENGEPLDSQWVSRIIEKDERFLELVDYEPVFPIIQELVGEHAKLIDYDAMIKPPIKSAGISGGWHRGVGTFGYHAENGRFKCLMVKVIYYLTDVNPGEGATRIIPGSHKAKFEPVFDEDRTADVPGSVEVTAPAGSAFIFSEALYHAGSPNLSSKVRRTLFYNYGPSWVEHWQGYEPADHLKESAEGVRRDLLGVGRVY